MPTIHALVSSPRVDAAAIGEIARTLVSLSGRLLGKAEAVTATVVETIAPTQWFVGTRSLADLDAASFRVVIRVTQGTNDKDEKAAFVAAASAAMARILGATRPESYVVVDEVPADAWGWGGETQEHRAIAARIAKAETETAVFDTYRRFGIR